MRSAQIKRLSDEGMEIGGHAVSHRSWQCSMRGKRALRSSAQASPRRNHRQRRVR